MNRLITAVLPGAGAPGVAGPRAVVCDVGELTEGGVFVDSLGRVGATVSLLDGLPLAGPVRPCACELGC